MRSQTPKALTLCLFGACLSGCSSAGSSDWIDLYKAVRQSWTSGNAVSLEQAAVVPYATLGIRIDGGQEQILVLATDTNGERLWTSSASVAVVTRNGRIFRTSGFGTDLTDLHMADAPSGATPTVGTHTRIADFADLGLYSVQIRCAVDPGIKDPITILGAPFETVRFDERCEADSLGWHFVNQYWLTPDTGRVWRAIQHIHPKGPDIEIELLRPPVGTN